MTIRQGLIVALMLGTASGCTSVQLRKNSAAQALAVHDFQQQQVLDNLAMFLYDPNSLPYFSYANQSGNSVNDQANGGVTAGWSRVNIFGPSNAGSALPLPLLFSALNLSGAAQRSQQEAFTITPVNDPRKLELMRCAYQTAISCCGRAAVAGSCPDCQTRFKVFYTGDPNGDIRQQANGIVTSDCLRSDCCWFHVGCKKCAPKHDSCVAVGEHCGCYVWVMAEGQDQLTKLTLAILDYATHDPPAKRMKTVEYNIDEYGLPTTGSTSVGKVTASVAIDERPPALIATGAADAGRLEQFLDYQHKQITKQLAATTNAQERKALEDQEALVQKKLDFIREQMRSGGLREQYYPRSPSPAGPGLLQLDMIQSTLPSGVSSPGPGPTAPPPAQ